MIVPEERVPRIFLSHAFLPLFEETAKLHKVGRLQCPFLAIQIIDLQVMETEDHGQLLLIRVRVAHTVLEGR